MAKKKQPTKTKSTKQANEEYKQHEELVLKLIQKKEPIHPDLERHIESGGIMGVMVRHPLIVSMVTMSGCFAYVNYLYKGRKEHAKSLMETRDWYGYVFVHALPYQLDVFAKIAKRLTDEEYWTILGAVYTESENLWRQKRKVVRLVTADRKKREFLMNGRERNYLAKQPNKLTIYRGYQYRNADGWSWTLDPKQAEWFARRFEARGGKPTVATATVNKRDVIAYFSRRREKEIVVDPAIVKIAERKVL